MADSQQTTMTNALVSHIACDLVPFSRRYSQYFRGFESALDQRYQVFTRKHLVYSILPEKNASMRSVNYSLKNNSVGFVLASEQKSLSTNTHTPPRAARVNEEDSCAVSR